MSERYKLIRYNTGTDKKLFTEFAKHFDAVLINATIAAYSGSAMADLVSIYKDNYVIDPQTYILQQNYDMLVSTTSKKGGIKKSIEQYLNQLPPIFLQDLNRKHHIDVDTIVGVLDGLVENVGEFELNYITSFIKDKEYNKYLEFENEENPLGKPQPQMLIAPYFMLKDTYKDDEIAGWMSINGSALGKFISKYGAENYPIAAQLVLEKGVLESIGDNDRLLSLIVETYNNPDFEYIFIWIDDFSPIESENKFSIAFSQLIKALNRIGKKPIMAYGGYDSILLCHKNSPTKLYGVAQSVGYGEKRQITPVGGGLPVNKFYFPPTHQRLKVEDVSSILSAKGYFDNTKSKKRRSELFYENICACSQCQEIIGDDIDNFLRYNDSSAFTMKSGIRRNRPTQDAIEISARHFLFWKKKEWEHVLNGNFEELIKDYRNCIDIYARYYDRNLYSHVLSWIKHYAE